MVISYFPILKIHPCQVCFSHQFFLKNFVSDIFKQNRMAGGRSGRTNPDQRKLVGNKTCFMFPRWVLFHVAWVLMATIKGKKKVTISKKRKNKKNEENI